MKSLLTLKHWQIFLIIWGIPLITMFIPLENMSGTIIVILTLLMAVGLFLWIYSIGTILHEKLNKDIKLSSKIFKIHIWSIAIIIVLVSLSSYFKEFLTDYFGVIFFIVIYYLISVFIVLRYVSKLLATIELGRLAGISDYLGYFFMFLFNPIGIWVLQPKIG